MSPSVRGSELQYRRLLGGVSWENIVSCPKKIFGILESMGSKVSGPFQIPGVDDEEMGSSLGGIWREILGADYTLAASVV